MKIVLVIRTSNILAHFQTHFRMSETPPLEGLLPDQELTEDARNPAFVMVQPVTSGKKKSVS